VEEAPPVPTDTPAVSDLPQVDTGQQLDAVEAIKAG
jgi:hypothetical protein